MIPTLSESSYTSSNLRIYIVNYNYKNKINVILFVFYYYDIELLFFNCINII